MERYQLGGFSGTKHPDTQALIDNLLPILQVYADWRGDPKRTPAELAAANAIIGPLQEATKPFEGTLDSGNPPSPELVTAVNALAAGIKRVISPSSKKFFIGGLVIAVVGGVLWWFKGRR